MPTDPGTAERHNDGSAFTRNLMFPYALFSLPESLEEYRSACMAISVYSLVVMLLIALFVSLSKAYVIIAFLAAFALLSAVSLVRMAWQEKVDSAGLYSFALGSFGWFVFMALVLGIDRYDGRPGSGLWLAVWLLSIVFWTPFFVRFIFHGRKLLNNADVAS